MYVPVAEYAAGEVVGGNANVINEASNTVSSSSETETDLQLCEICGQLNDTCSRYNSVISVSADNNTDHAYGVLRSTARSHKRTHKPLTRKRQHDPSLWKWVVRKRRRQSGLSYVTASGKCMPAKSPDTCKRDHVECRFKCNLNFDDNDREEIHQSHWALTDDDSFTMSQPQ